MYTALYREWRPRVFEDLIGQEYLVKILKNQIMTDRIAHAYLFCGTRGTGKTSTAKIFARAVNCLAPSSGDPCGNCEPCRHISAGTLIDVVEIDAASNNRVENIRDLIEDVKYPPHQARYKVYIIDEVHMLSISAFNALLKTLEEPPEHVIFILATTDPQKIPPTILSRCQRYDFRRIRSEDVFKLLRKIVDENGVFVEDKTLKAIARLSDGAMRDALSVLDQCMSMSQGRIDYEEVVSMLGLTGSDQIAKLVDLMIDRDIEAAFNQIDEILFGGKDLVQFIKDMIKHFRNLLMVKISKRPQEIIDLSEEAIAELKEQAKKIRSEELMRGINIFIETENDAKTVSQPRIRLEMAVIRFCRREYDSSPEMLMNRIGTIEEKLKSGNFTFEVSDKDRKLAATTLKAEKQSTNTAEPALVLENEYESAGDASPLEMDEIKTNWQEIIGYLNGNKNKVVSMLLSQGKINHINGHVLTIEFDESYSINKKILDQPEKRKIAEDAFRNTLKKTVRLQFIVTDQSREEDDPVEKMRKALGDDLLEIIE